MPTDPWPQPKLIVVEDHSYDMPTSWDGRNVEWSDWEVLWTTAEWHMPKEPCERCGNTDTPATCHGTLMPLVGETFVSTQTRRMKSGREREVAITVPAWPVIGLIASRCRSCHLDTVRDMKTKEDWTLDESDYGPRGSNEPAKTEPSGAH